MGTEETQQTIPKPVSQEDKLDKPVGTVEPIKLGPKPVKVVNVELKESKKKSGEVVGDILHITCKHPDQDDTIDLSKTKFLKGENLKESGLWYNEDTNGEILKASALATLLSFYKATSIKSLIGMDLETTSNAEGYLCIKSF